METESNKAFIVVVYTVIVELQSSLLFIVTAVEFESVRIAVVGE